VALGAAIRAAVLEGRKSDLTISDITSWSIAVEVYDKVEGVASVVIPRGHNYPTEKMLSFSLTNREPGQPILPIRLLAGDHDRAASCELLHAIDVAIDPQDARKHRIPLTIGLNGRGEIYGECGGVVFGSSD